VFVFDKKIDNNEINNKLKGNMTMNIKFSRLILSHEVARRFLQILSWGS